MLTARVYPDCNLCKTRHKFGSLWECLVDEPVHCAYLLPFGERRYCRYHRCREFEEHQPKATRGEGMY